MPQSEEQKRVYADKLATLTYYGASRTIKQLAELTGMSETSVREALQKIKVKPKAGSKTKITEWHIKARERRMQIREDCKVMAPIDVALKYNLTVERIWKIKTKKETLVY